MFINKIWKDLIILSHSRCRIIGFNASSQYIISYIIIMGGIAWKLICNWTIDKYFPLGKAETKCKKRVDGWHSEISFPWATSWMPLTAAIHNKAEDYAFLYYISIYIIHSTPTHTSYFCENAISTYPSIVLGKQF